MKTINEINKNIYKYAAETGCDSEIHLDDFIFQFLINNESFDSIESAVRYYFYDGKNSAKQFEQIVNDLKKDKSTTKVLEFASGYGCVTRHLANIFPQKNIMSCDIHKKACELIKKKLDVQTILSKNKPEDFNCNQKYDIIFALSFFSHMPNTTWKNWLSKLLEHLEPNGALVFTTQGLESAKYFDNPELSEEGYWFKADSEQKDLDSNEYGQTIVTSKYVNRCIASIGSKYRVTCKESFWWGHQDLYIVSQD
jgi:cyclopropane fatty-acyl-phospholipid synthase-like methyltransferase